MAIITIYGLFALQQQVTTYRNGLSIFDRVPAARCYADAISRAPSHVWHTGGKVYVPQIQ